MLPSDMIQRSCCVGSGADSGAGSAVCWASPASGPRSGWPGRGSRRFQEQPCIVLAKSLLSAAGAAYLSAGQFTSPSACAPVARYRRAAHRRRPSAVPGARAAWRHLLSRREIAKCLRTGRTVRRPRRQPGQRQPRFIDPKLMISERPAGVLDRAVPDHWQVTSSSARVTCPRSARSSSAPAGS